MGRFFTDTSGQMFHMGAKDVFFFLKQCRVVEAKCMYVYVHYFFFLEKNSC